MFRTRNPPPIDAFDESRDRDALGSVAGQARRGARSPARGGDLEHAPAPHPPHAGLDEPPLRGLSGRLARLLPPVRGRLLESPGCGGALRPHFRSTRLGADGPGALSVVPGLAVSRGPTGWASGGDPGWRPAHQSRKDYSKYSLKECAIKRWLFFPLPATSISPPSAVTSRFMPSPPPAHASRPRAGRRGGPCGRRGPRRIRRAARHPGGVRRTTRPQKAQRPAAVSPSTAPRAGDSLSRSSLGLGGESPPASGPGEPRCVTFPRASTRTRYSCWRRLWLVRPAGFPW